jgi:hypothetical protein
VIRSRHLRLWTVALWCACVLAATGGHLAGQRDAVAAGGSPVALRVLSQSPDAAVLPARVTDEVRAASHTTPLRVLLLGALLALLVGLPALARRWAAVAGGDHRLLRARGHSIALRAPPLLFA